MKTVEDAILPVTQEIAGSSPVGPASHFKHIQMGDSFRSCSSPQAHRGLDARQGPFGNHAGFGAQTAVVNLFLRLDGFEIPRVGGLVL